VKRATFIYIFETANHYCYLEIQQYTCQKFNLGSSR